MDTGREALPRPPATGKDAQYLPPFVGVDGEGSSRLNAYLLLRAGDRALEDTADLGSERCLDFLSRLPSGPIYVAYFFTYDVTMMLRDIDDPHLKALTDRASREIEETGRMEPVSVHGGRFQIDWLPGKEFAVRRRLGFNMSTGKMVYSPWVRVSDVGSFFQCSFVAALSDWFCRRDPDDPTIIHGDEPELIEAIDAIRAGKDQRATFGEVSAHERDYNRLEVMMLALLMHKFRRMCLEAEIQPYKWQGPGNIAAAMFRKAQFPRKAKALDKAGDNDITLHLTHPHLMSMANDSYTGGRFEPLQVGEIPGPIHYYDINSAYPYVYRFLPCLLHGKWRRVSAQPESGTYIGFVSFDHRPRRHAAMGMLPIRTKVGSIIFPMVGKGIYTSPELGLARRMGATVHWHTGYEYIPECECALFDFIPEMYAERKRLGKSGKGLTLKLGMNSIYGKLAQSIGRPVYSNPLWATLITGYVRAMLADMAVQRHNGEDVVMLATDGLFCRDMRDAPLGAGLGEWDCKVFNDILVIQSGLYLARTLTPDASVAPVVLRRTRGVPLSGVMRQEDDFRAAWASWDGNSAPPSVSVCLQNFISLRLALHRGKPELAGRWVATCDCPRLDAPHDRKEVAFQWRTKRLDLARDGSVQYTRAFEGGPNLESVAYGKDIGGMGGRYAERDFIEQDQPDWTVVG